MSSRRLLTVLPLISLVAACHERDWPPIDLSERMDAEHSRAGVITDESVLWGGISAEGRAGDLLIYNDRARFVVQAARPGDYYVVQGGGVIDADVVRPDGELGRDCVDEWGGMYGVGRLMDAKTVAVVADGTLGGPARVHAEGHESPMGLLTGAVESPDLVPDLGLDIAVDYELPPGSPLLKVTTTLTATDGDVTVQPGDVVMGALEELDPWDPGVGLDAPSTEDRTWSGYVGKHEDVAIALVAAPGGAMLPSPIDGVASNVQMASGFGEALTIPSGTSATYTRYYAVARDLATVTDAMADLAGTPTDTTSGTVTAPDGPVAGARVNVLVGGAPYTLAITQADGTFSAKVPKDADVTFLADGRGPGVYDDLPAGAGTYAPYAADPVHEAVIDSLEHGATSIPSAEGRGFGTSAEPLVLGQPGTLDVKVADGLPFEVRVRPLDPQPAIDSRLVVDRPSDGVAMAWARDGEVVLPVEAGRYDVVVDRGIRYEAYETTVTVGAGQATSVDAELALVVHPDGWLLGDPHMHASPSGDTAISMEDRLITSAALGLQLHFGTDHDHLADYRPLLAPLGLDQVLGSVVSDEVSPVLRGHLNIYPVVPTPGDVNNGAWSWWSDPVPDTTTEFARLRERHGDAFVLQVNHPTDKGMAESAGWSPGHIAQPDKFATGFDTVEVLNAGDVDKYLPFWWDCLDRGIVATAVGTSDSHTFTGGLVGGSATWIRMGTSDVAGYSDQALEDAMRAGQTVPTRGPFIETSILPGSVVVGKQTLTAEAISPTWIVIDHLMLVKDGEVVDDVPGTEATFTLDPDQDAAYTVVAEGSTPMAPVWPSKTPWAMTNAIRVDVDGNGWTAPLPGF